MLGQLAEGTFSSNLDLPPEVQCLILCPAFTVMPVFENSVSHRFQWKSALFNTQDTLGARFFYYPCLRDEETVIQRSDLTCQGSHMRGMEKLALKLKAENFKGCFLSTRLPCTGHGNYLLPADTINHRTEGKLGIAAERKSLIFHSRACLSFPCSYPSSSLRMVCPASLPFI